jgi:hypothetical protein
MPRRYSRQKVVKRLEELEAQAAQPPISKCHALAVAARDWADAVEPHKVAQLQIESLAPSTAELNSPSQVENCHAQIVK